MIGYEDLIWAGDQLRYGRRTVAAIEPDREWPACGVSAFPADRYPTCSTALAPKTPRGVWPSVP